MQTDNFELLVGGSIEMLDYDDLVKVDHASNNVIFAYNTPNLGDYIQMLAIMQHVSFSGFIMRDDPQPAPDKTLVANGWMTDGEFPKTSNYRDVNYVGIHIDPEYRSEATLEQLRDAAPIGCRDTSTLEYLSANGVPSVYCRCPTVTFPEYSGHREKIVCVNLEDKLFDRVQRVFGKHGEILRRDHYLDWLDFNCIESGSLLERLRVAYDSLMQYRSAKLVVTGKVHCALPSIAFGTPVIYTGPRDERFGIFEGLNLGEGWQRFKWYRAFNPFDRKTPTRINSDEAKKVYLNFLHSILDREPTKLEVQSTR